MSTYPKDFYSNYPIQNIKLTNVNKLTNKETLPIINDCLITRYHDVGCDCINCRHCKEEIIDFYKKKKKKKNKKNKSFQLTSHLTKSAPIDIPIKRSKTYYANDYMSLPHSLPNHFYNKDRKIIIDKCLLCNTKNNLNLINNFYLICNNCNIETL
jgi:hypothetical protein